MATEQAEEHARQLAAEAIAAGDPTSWFERLYAEAEAGTAVVPWDRRAPATLISQWLREQEVSGAGQSAVVVGCGLGDDAELIASLGFDTTAFDISPTAITAAMRRFPGSAVRYETADLLSPPAGWQQAFDLVVDGLALQSMPDPPRNRALAAIGFLVGPGGRLLVTARSREADQPAAGPPYALTRAEIDAIAGPGLRIASLEDLRDPPGMTPGRRWRVVYEREPAPGGTGQER
jgi:SAM-dependent methyltransferase